MAISYQEWGNKDAHQQILFIHGWGMNSGVWADIAESVEKRYPELLICSVDLPGYGHSDRSELASLGDDYTSETLALSLELLLQDKQTTIVAWSLGGLVAIDLTARNRSQISKLILVGSTPKFVQSDDWHDAVEARIFEEFSQNLVKDHQATLRRFLAIQAMGSRTARDDIKTLQSQLFARGEPDEKALQLGLKILLNADKRQLLKEISDIPIYLVAGKQDTLAKYAGQKRVSQQANITLHSLASSGHAPFISHPEEFKKILATLLSL
ncbi:MAG: alpha/beta fold hydrolase [Gammaproteobacteria bacterium]|nr:alpha/beta fold hydrolase [Gammaproteobacteria bacterium]